MSHGRYVRLVGLVMNGVAVCVLAGCGVSIGSPNGSGGGGDDDDRQSGDVAADTVLVAFANSTSIDVDTEFYASNEPMTDVEAELFVPANRIQVGIGVAGTGILLAGTADAIEVSCSDNLVLGTTGGTFKDPDLGTALGMGDMRILSEGLVFDCGDVLTFTYSQDGDDYSVDIL